MDNIRNFTTMRDGITLVRSYSNEIHRDIQKQMRRCKKNGHDEALDILINQESIALDVYKRMKYSEELLNEYIRMMEEPR